MKKRFIALLLALTLCLGLSLPAHAASGYSDVPAGHWSEESVTRATELGLFYGLGDGSFGLGQPVTRAAFVTALVRLFGWEETLPSKASFSDTTPDRWFYAAVETACANGALSGAGHAFRPTDNITREEMAAMLVRGLGYTSLAGAASSYSSPFTDVTTNKGFISLAYDAGIIGGVGDGRFHPTGTATREQAAAMLVRVYDRLYAKSSRLASASSYSQIIVQTPKAAVGDDIPTTPLEPLADLYNALRQMKDKGADMSRAALRLTAGGVRTITSGGKIISSEAVTHREVEDILAMNGVNTYYSDRYECAYCIYQPSPGQTATVWYQSDESMEAKLQLARLFGVTRYFMA